MKINVGSTNLVKVAAVRELVKDYKFLHDAEVVPVAVQSDVASPPSSLVETISGARNRAKNAFNSCFYSIGLEDGLMDVPYSATGVMNICVCDVFDGEQHYLGLSSAFEHPPEVVELILNKGFSAAQAYYELGLTNDKNIGSSEGAIGLLTHGQLNRTEYTKQAIRTALVHLEIGLNGLP